MSQLYLSTIAYNLALASAKCSIIVQCLRIFNQGKIVSSCWVYLTAMILYAISILCLNIMVCRPARDVLNNGSCISRAPLWYLLHPDFEPMQPNTDCCRLAGLLPPPLTSALISAPQF